MLDGRSKKIIATGTPQGLRDGSRDEWVRQFLNRRPVKLEGERGSDPATPPQN